jgi:hypothetical protein
LLWVFEVSVLWDVGVVIYEFGPVAKAGCLVKWLIRLDDVGYYCCEDCIYIYFVLGKDFVLLDVSYDFHTESFVECYC